jgi:hypothetical protein
MILPNGPRFIAVLPEVLRGLTRGQSLDVEAEATAPSLLARSIRDRV